MHEVLYFGVRLPLSGFEADFEARRISANEFAPFFQSDNIGGYAGMQAVYRIQGFVIGGESDFRRK